jgi:hypothetical protein
MVEKTSDDRRASHGMAGVAKAIDVAVNALVKARESLLLPTEELEELDDRHSYKGRKLPNEYVKCGSGELCGSVQSPIIDGTLHKFCSKDGGSCKQHGCACHLFRHEKDKQGQPKDDWHHFADPGEGKKANDLDYEYACICVEDAA